MRRFIRITWEQYQASRMKWVKLALDGVKVIVLRDGKEVTSFGGFNEEEEG